MMVGTCCFSFVCALTMDQLDDIRSEGKKRRGRGGIDEKASAGIE